MSKVAKLELIAVCETCGKELDINISFTTVIVWPCTYCIDVAFNEGQDYQIDKLKSDGVLDDNYK